MKRRTGRYILFICVELLVVVFLIVLFPRLNRIGPFRTLRSQSVRPEYRGEPANDLERRIIDLDIFYRSDDTRGIGVEEPRLGLLIFPGSDFEKNDYYYDTILMKAAERGIGGVVVDVMEAVKLVPQLGEGGAMRSPEEMRLLFSAALANVMLGYGFEEIAVWSFVVGKTPAVALLRYLPDHRPASSYVDFYGAEGAAAAETSRFPPTLIYINRQDRHLEKKLEFHHSLKENGRISEMRVLLDEFYGFVDAAAKPIALFWDDVLPEALDWSSFHAGGGPIPQFKDR